MIARVLQVLKARIEGRASFGNDLAAILSNFPVYPQSPEFIANFQRAYKGFQGRLENTLLPVDMPGVHEIKKGSQSKQFMIDMLPHIQKYIHKFPRGTRFDVADVGCGTGHGTNLLGSLYCGSELGYRMRVSGIDIAPTYHNYISVFCRFMKHIVVDVKDIEQTFDIVICSAVVEHVRSPFEFIKKLKAISHGVVFVYVPYKEDKNILTSGHVNIIDDEFLSKLDPVSIEFIESPAWGLFLTPRYKMVLAELRGTAPQLS